MSHQCQAYAETVNKLRASEKHTLVEFLEMRERSDRGGLTSRKSAEWMLQRQKSAPLYTSGWGCVQNWPIRGLHLPGWLREDDLVTHVWLITTQKLFSAQAWNFHIYIVSKLTLTDKIFRENAQVFQKLLDI